MSWEMYIPRSCSRENPNMRTAVSFTSMKAPKPSSRMIPSTEALKKTLNFSSSRPCNCQPCS